MRRLYWRIYQSIQFHDTESKTTCGFEVFTRDLFNRFPGALQCDCLSKRCTCSSCFLFSNQPICAKRRNHFQNDAVSPFKRRTEPNRFENVLRLITFSKRVGFTSGLDRRRQNERRNVIESYAVYTNKPCLCKQCPRYAFSTLATFEWSNNFFTFSFTGKKRNACILTSYIKFLWSLT